MSIDLTDEFLEKARKVRNGTRIPIVSSSGKPLNNFYYSSTPKEAVFKVINDHSNTGKGSIRGYTVKKLIEYIGRDKEDEGVYHLETHNGEIITSIDGINEIYNEWKTTFSSDKRKNGKDAIHAFYSTAEKPGQTNEEILAAARETVRNEFGDKGFEYLIALHTDKEHTHVHVVIRTFNPQTKKQLDLRKNDLENNRKSWANNLQEQGLNYVASININRIKSMSERLEYIKTKNMSWFEANMEKMKTTNVQELGDKLLKTQDEISTLKHRKNEINKELKTIFYNKDKNIKKDDLRTELFHIDKNISKKYADVKASITLLNNIEYEAQVANINYEKLRENQSKIKGVFVKNSRSYQELSQQVETARQIMLEKKLELDQAHIFLSKLNRDKKYNIDLESNKDITYGFSNLDTSIKTLKTILQEENRLEKSIISQSLLHIDKLAQAPNETTTYNNKKTIQNLTELKKEYLENNPLPKFNKEIRDIIHAELKSVLAAQKENYYDHKSLTKEEYLKSIRDIRSLQQNIRKNYEIPIYKLKKHGVDVSKFATKEVALKTNAIKLENDSDKNIVLNKLYKLKEDETFSQKFYLNKIIDQVKEQDAIYQSQLNRLAIDSKLLFKELTVKDFKLINIQQEVINTEKTYVNWENNLHQDKPKLNYEALVKNEDNLIKNLIEKIDSNLHDHNKREQEKINSRNLSDKDKILSAAKSITYALHSNLKELKDTQKYISAIQHEPSGLQYKDKLIQNQQEYRKLAVELNTKLNTFITNVQNSKLTKEEKTEIVKSVYTKLDDKNYANEIKKYVKNPTLDNEINKRHINQFKELTNELKRTKNPQELSELAAKSKSMKVMFNKSNMSFMEHSKVKLIEKNHKAILNSMNRGFGR